jgi:hypothetical protein
VGNLQALTTRSSGEKLRNLFPLDALIFDFAMPRTERYEIYNGRYLLHFVTGGHVPYYLHSLGVLTSKLRCIQSENYGSHSFISFSRFITYEWSRGNSVSIGLVSDYGVGDRSSIPDRDRIFLLAPASRPALGPTQPPVQLVPWVLSPGVKRGRGVMLTTHPQLVPRLRMSRSYTSSPPVRLHGM